MKLKALSIIVVGSLSIIACTKTDVRKSPEPAPFIYFGGDLSYANQILDHNGVYKDQGGVQSPYKIYFDHGANLVRLRLWHNPVWTKDVYGADGKQLYSDLLDAEKTIRLAKDQGMAVLLDFHYSDNWADAGKQEVPIAWRDIKDIAVLKDSVYQYTYKTLRYLDSRSIMPELVQIGNEINCGLFFTNVEAGFPTCNVCNDQWQQAGEVINKCIAAVRVAAKLSSVKSKVVLHVADPKNVEWWFDNIKTKGGVTDFDVVGFSYYPLWHTTVSVDKLSENISTFKKYGKDVMILETAYPWTKDGDDNYTNLFGAESPITGYPFSIKGQYDIMIKITQEVIDGGGSGIVYWEPDWITSAMKDPWGTGSAWENNTFFDFDGNVIQGIDFMKYEYKKN